MLFVLYTHVHDINEKLHVLSFDLRVCDIVFNAFAGLCFRLKTVKRYCRKGIPAEHRLTVRFKL